MMRVPVYERQAGINPMPGARMSAPGDANAWGAGVGAAGTGAADRAVEIAQDMEDARTLELFNAFKRESAEYHEHPDKGLYNARKGFGAAGATKDADAWLESKAGEYARKMPGARARRNFQRMAGQLRDTMYERNSRFEAGEIKKYRDGEADAAIQNGLDDIAANYDDDAAVERIKQGMTDALELKTRGMGEEARKAALAETENQIATTRLARMIQEDPVKASKWFDMNRDSFTGTGAAKAEEAVKKAEEIYLVQEAVDDLARRFPQGKEREGLEWIRKNYSGPLEERIASAYKMRRNEEDIDENQERRLKALQQEQNEDALYKMWVRDGKLDQGLVDQMLLSDKISKSAHDSFSRLTATQGNRARIEKRLLSANPDMTRDELDIEVMRQMGTTDEDHREIYAMAAQAVMTGQMKEYQLDALYQQGKLDTSEVELFKGRMKAWDKAQSAHYSNEAASLKQSLKELETIGIDESIGARAQEQFAIQAASLDMRSPTYREELFKLKKDILLNAIDNSGVGLNGMLWGRSSMGEARDRIVDSQFGDKGIDPFPQLPPVPQARDLDLGDAPRGRGATLAGSTGSVGKDFIGGAGNTPTNGDYGKPRDGGKRSHGGQDYAIAAGTEVNVPQQFQDIELKVHGVGKDSTSGNKLHLKGEANGHKFDIFMCHFQDGSIQVKNGQTVTAGAALAKVGSTGHSSGPHLHIETKIDGVRVDPKKFYEIIGWDVKPRGKTKPKAKPKRTDAPASGDVAPDLNGIFTIPAPQ